MTLSHPCLGRPSKDDVAGQLDSGSKAADFDVAEPYGAGVGLEGNGVFFAAQVVEYAAVAWRHFGCVFQKLW